MFLMEYKSSQCYNKVVKDIETMERGEQVVLLDNLPKTINLLEVAEKLEVNRDVLFLLEEKGEIEIIKLGGRYKVLESSLENYLIKIGLLKEETQREYNKEKE